MRPVRSTLTYVGIAVTVAGFALILFSWGRIAGQTSVPFQLPYLVSGGLTGLGLIMVGLTIVNVQAKRRDAAARERQIAHVREVLDQIQVVISGESAEQPATDDRANDDTDALPAVGAAAESQR